MSSFLLTRPISEIELTHNIWAWEQLCYFCMARGAELARWLEGVDPKAAKALIRRVHLVALPPETTLYAQGDRVRGIYIVLEGIVKEAAFVEDCLRFIRLSGPGDLLGIGELFSDPVQTMSAVALRQTRLAYIEHSALQKIFPEHPDILLWLMRKLSTRLWGLRTALVETVYVESTTRLTQKLLEVAERFGECTPQGVVIDLKLSREEWAALVGIAPETVSRVLHDLERRGWVALEGRRIWLLVDLAHRVA